MARIVYTLLLRLASPFVWCWIWHRARRAGGDWDILGAERFGAYPLPWDGAPPVWVHAVSLGETRAALSLIQALVARGDRVLLTHTTATGREQGARSFAAEIAAGQLRQQWLPYDFPGATGEFIAHYRPRLGLIIEREVWPNLMQAAFAARVPVMLVNARFSARSLRGVVAIDRVFGRLMRDAYGAFSLALAQTEDDARRLYEAGARNVVVTGNLKFDLPLPVVAVDAGRAWREHDGRPIVSIASTREGEDELFMPALVALCDDAAPLFLLIPRHPQRFEAAAALLVQSGLRFARWSQIRHDAQAGAELAGVQVVLGDTLGEMPFFYAASRVAIVGGSFAPLGGQNLIEACAVGTPVIVGPHTRNFEDAVQGAVAIGAAAQVSGGSPNDLAREALELALAWLRDPQALDKRAQTARTWVASHMGATARTLQEISDFEAGPARPAQHPD